ncbi:FISUMP domain-containing protein [Flavobacterium humidisoli]|uniref:FISUMP domain-containing protein n=1 Tax=Flavobacterium humidisoli TaxID=2937442 RepID=UPI003B8481B3
MQCRCSDYYNSAVGEPTANEGLLCHWSAAINGSTAARAQGVCLSGWHVPSDCEWMFLENTLGMTVANQIATGERYSGCVRTDLKIGGSSGVSGLRSGNGNFVPAFFDRGSVGIFWPPSVRGSYTLYRYLP